MRPEHWLYTIPLRLRSLFRRAQADHELDDELRDHLDRKTEEYAAQGMTQEEARRRARLDLGGIEQTKEKCRDARRVKWIQDFVQDLRVGLRILRKSPGFTVVAVLTLALGIGANTAIFSAVNPILFEPLPYPHPDRIMMVWDVSNGSRSDVTFHTYREIAERNRSFDALAVLEPWQPTMVGLAEPERLDGQSVSHGYFRALGVAPGIGRDFQPSDDASHGLKVAILSYGLWQRRFGGDHAIIGHQVTLDGDGYTVIGVMPGTFENVLAPTVEIWSPEQYDPGHITNTDSSEWGHHLRMVGRLQPGVALAQAKADIDMIARTPVAEFPRPLWAALRSGFIVDSLQGDVTRGVKPALLAVLGAVVVVLCLCCAKISP